MISDESYWILIKELIENLKIDFYIPLIDEEIVEAKRNIEDFGDVKVISPAADFSELCLNKFVLMQRLKEANISDVISYTGDFYNSELGFPIFIKPISGRGSRGIMKIKDADQLDAYYKLEGYTPEEILIQPMLTGVEYTVGALTNNRNDLLSISSKRIIKKKGITQIAITENNQAIDQIVKKIVEEFKPCGPFNVQLILTPSGDIKVFEINPRFSTTTIMEIEGGADPIRAYLEYFDKDYKGPFKSPVENMYLHRRWENIFYNA
ncbi:MAG: ATP-grasp domain-containing protein [Daejeonella sp.]|uniref:ATP-grasp domain-containing protein n=1 Tax=Daejeonella sp. TaxID=2805397 RepID=UPI0027334ADA|nr:ATP-grasp domain-containing protein [Daejeonella sp.]MDP3467529.1 ATP-grasp domain-containing protein [Daejeonella sp.]